MIKILTRIAYGALFAIPLMLVTYMVVQASQPAQAIPPDELDCSVCHPAFFEAWSQGAHGNATTDPAFQNAWESQGKPQECLECHVTGFDEETGTWKGDGITCQACHSPIPANHPMEPMAADRSAKLCGQCHAETYFEWQISAHREGGLDCSGCHDPHATGLKAENNAMLCASCHRDRASNFTHSAHSQQGLTCSDCHLNELTDKAQEGHARKDHSFFVSLTACNRCHVYQMHDPVEVHPESPTPVPPDAMASVETLSVAAEPVPVSPVGFTALAGLLGVALGVVIAPWLEKIQNRRECPEETSGGQS